MLERSRMRAPTGASRGPRPLHAADAVRRRPAARAPRRGAAGRRPGRRTPAGTGLVAVKRATATPSATGGWWVERDNPRRGRGLAGWSARSPDGDVRRGRAGRLWPLRRRGGPASRRTGSIATMLPRPTDARPAFAGDPVFDLHLGGKMEIALDRGARRPRRPVAWPTPRVWPGCARRSPRTRALVDDYTWVSQHRRRGHRRHRRARPRRHRPGGRDAGDGGQGGAVQAVRRRRRRADLPGHPDADEIVETVARLAPSFGGINLEDISAPRCFEIEQRLKELLDIPVFHDDQHGTAVVALAALENALRLTGRAARAHPRGDLRRRRGRGRGHPDPARRRASPTSPSPTAGACCTPAAATSPR